MIPPNTPLKVGELLYTGMNVAVREGQLWRAQAEDERIGIALHDIPEGQTAAHDGCGNVGEYLELQPFVDPDLDLRGY
ncbi:MAG: hypothetical protein V4466_12080 [Pseudomonadota bacterium]